MRWIVLVACAGTLVGCAASTGVLPAGPDTYTLTEKFAPVRGGGTEAERVALTKAHDFCAEKGRIFVPHMMSEAGTHSREYGSTGYSVTFRCLLASDPAVASYRGLQSAPNVIVEQRNR